MASSSAKKAKKSAADKTPDESYRFETGATTGSIKSSILNHLCFTLARHPENATKDEWWTATCYAVRDRVLDRFMKTQEVHHNNKKHHFLNNFHSTF